MKTKLHQRKFKVAAIVVLALAQVFGVGIHPRAVAEGGVPSWTNRVERGLAVVVDLSGDILYTGSSGWDPILHTGTSSGDARTTKYSNSGVPVWTTLYSGPSGLFDNGSRLGVDSSGNVVVVGLSEVEPTYPLLEYFTLKYSASGVPLWTNRFDSGQDYWSNDFGPPQVALDAFGNAFVTGTVTNSSGLELRIIKYSPSGVALWTNLFANAYATAIQTDRQNNVVVVGYGSAMRAYNGFLVLKYSNAGGALWNALYNGFGTNSSASALNVAVDSQNDVLVTGRTGRESVAVKFSPTGVPLWTNLYRGDTHFSARARAVTVDSGDNVIVASEGRSSVGTGYPGDYCTIKYSNAGVPLWTNLLSGEQASPFAVVVDHNDNICVGGYLGTVAYSPAGEVHWEDRGFLSFGLAVDPAGHLYAVGRFDYPWHTSQYAIVKYSAIPGTHVSLRISRDGGGGYVIRATSSPDLTFRLQRASTLSGPWADVSTNTAPLSGVVDYHETAPLPNQGFYRAVQ